MPEIASGIDLILSIPQMEKKTGVCTQRFSFSQEHWNGFPMCVIDRRISERPLTVMYYHQDVCIIRERKKKINRNVQVEKK